MGEVELRALLDDTRKKVIRKLCNSLKRLFKQHRRQARAGGESGHYHHHHHHRHHHCHHHKDHHHHHQDTRKRVIRKLCNSLKRFFKQQQETG
jgi:hypothetical protein